MSIKAVLFDLDGSLLPMNQDKFINKYFKLISAYLYSHGGYEPNAFMKSMWLGIGAMLKNDGSQTNESAFWSEFYKIYGVDKVKGDMMLFEQFYKEQFPETKTECGTTPYSKMIVDFLKGKGVKVALATNPVFPPIATNTRMGWVGLTRDDFSLVTTYDNISYCKPNPSYYIDIANRLGVLPEECLMVGNDTSDDMSATKTGMSVYLLTDCLINSNDSDMVVVYK